MNTYSYLPEYAHSPTILGRIHPPSPQPSPGSPSSPTAFPGASPHAKLARSVGSGFRLAITTPQRLATGVLKALNHVVKAPSSGKRDRARARTAPWSPPVTLTHPVHLPQPYSQHPYDDVDYASPVNSSSTHAVLDVAPIPVYRRSEQTTRNSPYPRGPTTQKRTRHSHDDSKCSTLDAAATAVALAAPDTTTTTNTNTTTAASTSTSSFSFLSSLRTAVWGMGGEEDDEDQVEVHDAGDDDEGEGELGEGAEVEEVGGGGEAVRGRRRRRRGDASSVGPAPPTPPPTPAPKRERDGCEWDDPAVVEENRSREFGGLSRPELVDADDHVGSTCASGISSESHMRTESTPPTPSLSPPTASTHTSMAPVVIDSITASASASATIRTHPAEAAQDEMTDDALSGAVSVPSPSNPSEGEVSSSAPLPPPDRDVGSRHRNMREQDMGDDEGTLDLRGIVPTHAPQPCIGNSTRDGHGAYKDHEEEEEEEEDDAAHLYPLEGDNTSHSRSGLRVSSSPRHQHRRSLSDSIPDERVRSSFSTSGSAHGLGHGYHGNRGKGTTDAVLPSSSVPNTSTTALVWDLLGGGNLTRASDTGGAYGEDGVVDESRNAKKGLGGREPATTATPLLSRQGSPPHTKVEERPARAQTQAQGRASETGERASGRAQTRGRGEAEVGELRATRTGGILTASEDADSTPLAPNKVPEDGLESDTDAEAEAEWEPGAGAAPSSTSPAARRGDLGLTRDLNHDHDHDHGRERRRGLTPHPLPASPTEAGVASPSPPKSRLTLKRWDSESPPPDRPDPEDIRDFGDDSSAPFPSSVMTGPVSYDYQDRGPRRPAKAQVLPRRRWYADDEEDREEITWSVVDLCREIGSHLDMCVRRVRVVLPLLMVVAVMAWSRAVGMGMMVGVVQMLGLFLLARMTVGPREAPGPVTLLRFYFGFVTRGVSPAGMFGETTGNHDDDHHPPHPGGDHNLDHGDRGPRGGSPDRRRLGPKMTRSPSFLSALAKRSMGMGGRDNEEEPIPPPEVLRHHAFGAQQHVPSYPIDDVAETIPRGLCLQVASLIPEDGVTYCDLDRVGEAYPFGGSPGALFGPLPDTEAKNISREVEPWAREGKTPAEARALYEASRWEHMLEHQEGAWTYTMSRRLWRRGLYVYKSRLTLEEADVDTYRAFHFDDLQRQAYDDTAVDIHILPPDVRETSWSSTWDRVTPESCFVYNRAKLPAPFAPRDYVYARRVFQGQDLTDLPTESVNERMRSSSPPTPQVGPMLDLEEYVRKPGAKTLPSVFSGSDEAVGTPTIKVTPDALSSSTSTSPPPLSSSSPIYFVSRACTHAATAATRKPGRHYDIKDFVSVGSIRAGPKPRSVVLDAIYFDDLGTNPGMTNVLVVRGILGVMRNLEASFRTFQRVLIRGRRSREEVRRRSLSPASGRARPEGGDGVTNLGQKRGSGTGPGSGSGRIPSSATPLAAATTTANRTGDRRGRPVGPPTTTGPPDHDPVLDPLTDETGEEMTLEMLRLSRQRRGRDKPKWKRRLAVAAVVSLARGAIGLLNGLAMGAAGEGNDLGHPNPNHPRDGEGGVHGRRATDVRGESDPRGAFWGGPMMMGGGPVPPPTRMSTPHITPRPSRRESATIPLPMPVSMPFPVSGGMSTPPSTPLHNPTLTPASTHYRHTLAPALTYSQSHSQKENTRGLMRDAADVDVEPSYAIGGGVGWGDERVGITRTPSLLRRAPRSEHGGGNMARGVAPGRSGGGGVTPSGRLDTHRGAPTWD